MKVQCSPCKICVDFILIFHPCVSVHKKLRDGQKCHEDENNQGHCTEEPKRSDAIATSKHILQCINRKHKRSPVPPKADVTT